ncbi:MFS transporter [Actinomycetaceae bacterium L2_0104]
MSNPNENGEKKIPMVAIAPVMLGFVVMGFVDLVGTASNFQQGALQLNSTQANLLSTAVFIWFLILAVPTGSMMNKIGKRNTALISIAVTGLALLIPSIAYVTDSVSFPLLIVSYCLLGIGNTLLQVSLNPLLATFVTGDRLAGTLSLGQFFKAIASLSAPLLAGNILPADKWWLIYPIFLAFTILGYVMLQFDKVEEGEPDKGTPTVLQSLGLLKNRVALLCFIGIICHVGIDVGMNGNAPKFMSQVEFGDSLHGSEFAYLTFIYFCFRLLSALGGSFLLQKISRKAGLQLCSVLIVLAAIVFVAYLTIPNAPAFLAWIGVALVGLGNTNTFTLFLSSALLNMPDKQNAVSGLMMMGIVGGAVIPLLMGAVSDAVGTQLGAVGVTCIAVLYVVVVSFTYNKSLASKNG